MLFLDTAFAVALSVTTDKYHQRAKNIAMEMKANDSRMVTTRAVILEIGNALSKLRYRNAAIQLLESLERDPSVEIISLTEQMYNQAFSLFRSRRDKEWGITDCISFVVMKERNITDALTTDEHFEQAGFKVMLREE